jgi:hypothetical protein
MMKIVADGLDNGNGYSCKLSSGANQRPSLLTRVFEWKAEFDSPVIFWDSGSGQWGNVHAENHFHQNAHSGWRFMYVGHGRYNNHLCWGVPSPGYEGMIGDQIGIFDAEHCLAHACVDDSYCSPSGPRVSHCRKVANNAPIDICIWDDNNHVGGFGGQNCPTSPNECETHADCTNPALPFCVLQGGIKICDGGELPCPPFCEDWQYCRNGGCFPLVQIPI